MGPPNAERATLDGGPTETLCSTASPAISDEVTPQRFADLEARVSKLEQKRARRKPKACITNENGDTFVPGAGWIRRWVAA